MQLIRETKGPKPLYIVKWYYRSKYDQRIAAFGTLRGAFLQLMLLQRLNDNGFKVYE